MTDEKLEAWFEVLRTRQDVVIEMGTQLLAFQRVDHTRLVRIESMLMHLMERERIEQMVKPNTEQARQLSAMGLAAWDAISRTVTVYDVWKEGFDKKMRAQEELMRGTTEVSPTTIDGDKNA